MGGVIDNRLITRVVSVLTVYQCQTVYILYRRHASFFPRAAQLTLAFPVCVAKRAKPYCNVGEIASRGQSYIAM